MAVAGFGLAAMVGQEGFPLGNLVAGTAVFAGPWLVVHLITPSNIGFGDIKLAAGLGLYVGWLGVETALLALYLVGLLAVIPALGAIARSRRAEPLPFGPALVGGAALTTAGHLLFTG